MVGVASAVVAVATVYLRLYIASQLFALKDELHKDMQAAAESRAALAATMMSVTQRLERIERIINHSEMP